MYITLQNWLSCTAGRRYTRRFQRCKGRISAGIYIYFFQALEFRLPKRWLSGSGDWELCDVRRVRDSDPTVQLLVVRTFIFFGLVYQCCWVISRFLDSGLVLLKKLREALACIYKHSACIFEHMAFRSPREAAAKLMIDGGEYHLLDPVVQRKDDFNRRRGLSDR